VVSAGLLKVHFIDATKSAFSFLEADGFNLTESDASRITYKSHRCLVTIVWDARSGEVDVLFALNPGSDEPSDAISLTDLLRVEGVDVANMPFQVQDENKLKPFLVKLANQTQAHAQSALAGDRMYFRRLQSSRNSRAWASMRDLDTRQIRADAEAAWHRREFGQVIAYYTSIEDQLTASEKAKLAFARHQHHAG
jgi:hypothetical protein